MSDSDDGPLVRMQSFGGDEYVRCTTCGAEAPANEEHEHHDQCPEVNDGE